MYGFLSNRGTYNTQVQSSPCTVVNCMQALDCNQALSSDNKFDSCDIGDEKQPGKSSSSHILYRWGPHPPGDFVSKATLFVCCCME